MVLLQGSTQVIEALSAAGLLGAAFLMGLKWILTHTTNLQEHHNKLVEQLITDSQETHKKLGEVIGQNTAALERVTTVIEHCERKAG